MAGVVTVAWYNEENEVAPNEIDPTTLTELLHPSEEVHRVVLGAISDAVFITDDSGYFTYICPNVETIFGHSYGEVVAMEKINALLGEQLPAHEEILTSGEVANLERVIRDKAGEVHTLLVNIKQVEVERGTILYTCRDITERKRIETRLAERNQLLFEQVRLGRDRLRLLARREVTAQERERARISRELHDEAGQYLTALQIMVTMSRDLLPDEPEACRERLEEGLGVIDSVTERIRLIAHGLRPPALDTLGIRATLAGLCREVARQSRLPIDYDGERVRGLGDDAMITLYRFLQEALTNTIKHADSTRVKVRFFQEGTEVGLVVEDDGVGFDPGSELSESLGLGLAGMRERMDFLGGTLEVDSSIGCGTRLTARLPL